jgi:hypothetical protein
MSSEARNLTDRNAEELAHWCGGLVVKEHDALDHSNWTPGINLRVGDDVQRASVGDTIIRKNDGTFEIFKGTTN